MCDLHLLVHDAGSGTRGRIRARRFPESGHFGAVRVGNMRRIQWTSGQGIIGAFAVMRVPRSSADLLITFPTTVRRSIGYVEWGLLFLLCGLAWCTW